MYHNPLGPTAATGLTAGAGLFAFTGLDLVWILLAAFTVASAIGALLRVLPASVTEAPRALVTRSAQAPARS